ncbi:MAG: site-specific DNA-methyltransferase, partial [Helicobacteraceae bacterium]|nr:site-specific DNA-methyltransferase [Helicobacteraceae bacterium]
KGDIILDPFSGSGTTLVQANELGMHAIGVDVSAFNSLIANCKTAKYDMSDLQEEIQRITYALKTFSSNSYIQKFEEELTLKLNDFNNKYFPAQEYKYRLRQGEIDEERYGAKKEKEFLSEYVNLIERYNVRLRQERSDTFLNKWYLPYIRKEIEFVFSEIERVKNATTRDMLRVILSRVVRSCRATSHADLATLLEPVTTTYYCAKHGKICKPLFSILKWWKTYSKDAISRLLQFDKLRSPTFQKSLTGDSRTIDIIAELQKTETDFASLAQKQKIAGIFSSPPYVGLIDYHEQHAYSYELFGFERKDELEIGRLSNGQGQEAKENYILGVSAALNNCKRFFADGYNVFLVANDKYNIYPIIAKNAGMQIVNQFKRPVLNRTEKDKKAYSETIFHLKEK